MKRGRYRMGKRLQIPLGTILGLVLFGVVFAYNKYISDFVAYIILAVLFVLLGLSIYRRKWMAFTISFVSSAVGCSVLMPLLIVLGFWLMSKSGAPFPHVS
jgi:4-hydroxybenzoate polyprenyltransferase